VDTGGSPTRLPGCAAPATQYVPNVLENVDNCIRIDP
jgi:hypothetical protein